MTSLDSAAPTKTCCRRPMTTIQVTSPLSVEAATLSLHTCSACGRHEWERDGVVLEREEVLGVVRDRVSEGPAPRIPRPRAARTRKPVVDVTETTNAMKAAEVREQLSHFVPHGRS